LVSGARWSSRAGRADLGVRAGRTARARRFRKLRRTWLGPASLAGQAPPERRSPRPAVGRDAVVAAGPGWSGSARAAGRVDQPKRRRGSAVKRRYGPVSLIGRPVWPVMSQRPGAHRTLSLSGLFRSRWTPTVSTSATAQAHRYRSRWPGQLPVRQRCSRASSASASNALYAIRSCSSFDSNGLCVDPIPYSTGVANPWSDGASSSPSASRFASSNSERSPSETVSAPCRGDTALAASSGEPVRGPVVLIPSPSSRTARSRPEGLVAPWQGPSRCSVTNLTAVTLDPVDPGSYCAEQLSA